MLQDPVFGTKNWAQKWDNFTDNPTKQGSQNSLLSRSSLENRFLCSAGNCRVAMVELPARQPWWQNCSATESGRNKSVLLASTASRRSPTEAPCARLPMEWQSTPSTSFMYMHHNFVRCSRCATPAAANLLAQQTSCVPENICSNPSRSSTTRTLAALSLGLGNIENNDCSGTTTARCTDALAPNTSTSSAFRCCQHSLAARCLTGPRQFFP